MFPGRIIRLHETHRTPASIVPIDNKIFPARIGQHFNTGPVVQAISGVNGKIYGHFQVFMVGAYITIHSVIWVPRFRPRHSGKGRLAEVVLVIHHPVNGDICSPAQQEFVIVLLVRVRKMHQRQSRGGRFPRRKFQTL